MEDTVKQRLVKFLKKEGLSQGRFEKQCGFSNGYVANISKSIGTEKIDTILSNFPHLNRDWLLYGEGEMLNPSVATNDKNHYNMVPLYHIDSVGGMSSTNDIIQEPQYVERLIPFNGAKDGDIAIWESGDSMSPTIPAGAIILIRKVEDWQDYFGYGHVYVLLLKDGRRITKEIRKYHDNPQEFVLCVSHNPKFVDEELPKKLIVGVWKVIRVLYNC